MIAGLPGERLLVFGFQCDIGKTGHDLPLAIGITKIEHAAAELLCHLLFDPHLAYGFQLHDLAEFRMPLGRRSDQHL